MNRASKRSAGSLIAVLVLLASTAVPQQPSSASPPSGKQPADRRGNKDAALSANGKTTTKKTSGRPSPTATPVHDPASQPVTEGQIKTMVTQTQHAKDVELLKQNFEKEINSLKEGQSPSQKELDALKQQAQRSMLFAVFGTLVGGTALVAVILLFFMQARSFEHELRLLRQDALRQANELSKEISALRLKGKNFVSGERFEGLETVVTRQEERLKALRPVRTFAGTEPPTQSWSPESEVQQEVSQTSSTFAAAASAPARVITLYADRPDRDGCFKDLKDRVEWNSLYELTLEDPDTARVGIYSGSERFDAAMKADQQYLSPVCEYQSNPPSSAKTIKQIRSGRAMREGQSWRVIDKLKIEFV